MAVWGADYQELKNFAKAVKQDADKIEAIAKTLGPKIKSLQWKGPDADTFKNNWDSMYERNLKMLATILDGVAKEADKNAEDQNTISS